MQEVAGNKLFECTFCKQQMGTDPANPPMAEPYHFHSIHLRCAKDLKTKNLLYDRVGSNPNVVQFDQWSGQRWLPRFLLNERFDTEREILPCVGCGIRLVGFRFDDLIRNTAMEEMAQGKRPIPEDIEVIEPDGAQPKEHTGQYKDPAQDAFTNHLGELWATSGACCKIVTVITGTIAMICASLCGIVACIAGCVRCIFQSLCSPCSRENNQP